MKKIHLLTLLLGLMTVLSGCHNTPLASDKEPHNDSEHVDDGR